MTIFQVVVLIVLIGLALMAINKWIPMDAKIKKILNVFIVVCVVIWLVAMVFPGVLGSLRSARVPTVD